MTNNVTSCSPYQKELSSLFLTLNVGALISKQAVTMVTGSYVVVVVKR